MKKKRIIEPPVEFTDPVTGEITKVDFNNTGKKDTVIFGRPYADKTLKGVCHQEFPQIKPGHDVSKLPESEQ
jgi:hypothetical protein